MHFYVPTYTVVVQKFIAEVHDKYIFIQSPITKTRNLYKDRVYD